MGHMTDYSALVTGASRGIGLGIAEMLARKGYGLTLAARDPARLADAAARLREIGAPETRVVPGDVADPDYPAALAAAHRDAFGGMRCLVLNAGVGTAGPIADYPLRRFDKTVAVNLRAPFALLAECLPMLREHASAGGGARVLALSSITGVYAEGGLAAYGATKAALASLVETLNVEESGNGVAATAICPGYVETDMSAWVTDRVPAESMIPVADVVGLAEALVELSPRTVVSQIVVHRAGTSGYIA